MRDLPFLKRVSCSSIFLICLCCGRLCWNLSSTTKHRANSFQNGSRIWCRISGSLFDPNPQRLTIFYLILGEGSESLLSLRSCGPATEPETPQIPENTKKYKIPHPGLAPENTEKIPKKNENGPKTAIFGPFLYFFC